MATNSSYFEKNVNLVVALGPIIVADEISTPMNVAQMWFYKFKEPFVEWFPRTFQMRPWFVDELLIGYGCAYGKPGCDWMMTQIATTTNEHSDYERTKIYFGHYPKGSSIRTWLYLYQ